MQLRQFQEREDSKAVWLTDPELTQLLDQVQDDVQRFGLGLMGRSGLRVSEAQQVRADDLIETDAGKMVRVWHGKGDKYRETPVTEETYWLGRSLDRGSGTTIVRHTRRTLQRWVERAAGEMFAETEEVGWTYVSAHDLRRSWATNLAAAGVDPLLVLDVGGWEDLETFLEHYRGSYSPEAHRREREKVDWI